MERTVAIDSGVTVVAKRGGHVDYVDASRIVVKVNESEMVLGEAGIILQPDKIYAIKPKHMYQPETNYCDVGEPVVAGDVLADGPSTDLVIWR